MSDVNPQLTLVSDEVRLSLAEDPNIGAGNFLQYALNVSPNSDAPILCLEQPFISPDGLTQLNVLSLKDLEYFSAQYAAYYWNLGVRPQDPIAVYRSDGVEYLLHYLALARIGAIGVLTNGNLEPSVAALYFRKIGVVGGFLDQMHMQQIIPYLKADDFPKFLVCDADAKATDWALLAAPPRFKHVNSDPIMIAHSSGTTGIPKPVLLQHGKFFYGARTKLRTPRMSGSEGILSSLPHSHNCAVAYIMLALLSGTPVYITSDHSGANVLAAIRKFKPTMVVSFPQTYVELMEQDYTRDDLASVSLWFNGGDAAHESHIRQLVAQGSRLEGSFRVPGSAFIDGMGSSEMGFSLFRHVHTTDSHHYGRCVGKPLDWVEAAVLAEDGTELPRGSVGRLGVKAPSVTSGYWNDSLLTFQSRLSGYFLTGDLAYQDEGGFFYHVDRVPDAVKTRHGVVYSLEAEELILSRNAAISDCTVVARPGPSGDEAVAFVRPRPGMTVDLNATLRDANQALLTKGRAALTAVYMVLPQDIPLGTTGKVLKRKLRERAAQPTKGLHV